MHGYLTHIHKKMKEKVKIDKQIVSKDSKKVKIDKQITIS